MDRVEQPEEEDMKLKGIKEPKLEEPDYLNDFDEFEYPEDLESEPVEDPKRNRKRRQNKHYQPYGARRSCEICGFMDFVHNLVSIKSNARKLITMVGFILKGRKTVGQAERAFLKDRLVMCRTHPSEALHQIHANLNLQSSDMSSICVQSMHEIMRIVNFLFPELTFSDFREILNGSNKRGVLKRDGQNNAISDNHHIEKKPVVELLLPKMEMMPELLEAKLEEFERPNEIKLEVDAESDNDRNSSLPNPTTNMNRRCKLCSKHTSRLFPNATRCKDRKLVVLVGVVFGGRLTIENAQLLMSRCRIFLCLSHYSEAVHEIYQVLNIKKMSEIRVCFNANVEKLMAVVSQLAPVTFTKFREILTVYVGRLDSGKDADQSILEQIGEENNGIDSERSLSSLSKASKSANRRCQVCHEQRTYQTLSAVHCDGRKLITLVGMVVGGHNTMESAQTLMSRRRFFTCPTHCSEAIHEINEALNIKKIIEMQMCSMEKTENLMKIVNVLAPKVTFPEFSAIFTTNVARLNLGKAVESSIEAREGATSRLYFPLLNAAPSSSILQSQSLTTVQFFSRMVKSHIKSSIFRES